jgi:hypothetical protein
MAESIAKPKQFAISGGTVGLTGTAIKIKIVDGRVREYTRIEETTGDGDDDPTFATSGYVYASVSLRGIMLQSAKANTHDTIETGSSHSVTITLDTSRTLVGTMIVVECTRDPGKTRAQIPMRISGQFTGSYAEN